MARRGEELQRHILGVAKDVFIELGYERTSMDEVAARAGTSKRSLYAHFENKDKLFGAVITLARNMYLGRLGTPAEYGDEPAEAIVAYCGRFVQILLWTKALGTLRLGVAEAGRLPDAAAGIYEAIFGIPERRLADYLADQYPLRASTSGEIASQLLGRVVYPQLVRTLLGVDLPLAQFPDEAALADDVDLESLRAIVAGLIPGGTSDAAAGSA